LVKDHPKKKKKPDKNEPGPPNKRSKTAATLLKFSSYTAGSNPKHMEGTSYWLVSRTLSGQKALKGRIYELLERAPDDTSDDPNLALDYPITCTEKKNQTRTPHRYCRATPWSLVFIRRAPSKKVAH
jgi:hypothetical protein